MYAGLAEIFGFEWEKRDVNLDKENTEEHVAIERLVAIMKSVSLGSTRAYDSRLMLNPHGLVDFYFIFVSLTDKGTFTGGNVCDLQRGFYLLFVFCDIIEKTVVGDSKVPLLRIVNINGKEGLRVSRIYLTVKYIPLRKRHFGTVEIGTRDNISRIVPLYNETAKWSTPCVY